MLESKGTVSKAIYNGHDSFSSVAFSHALQVSGGGSSDQAEIMFNLKPFL